VTVRLIIMDAFVEPPVELTSRAAWCFIVVASASLVTLYFLIDYLIYIVIVMFCLLGAQCKHAYYGSRVTARSVVVRFKH